MSIDTAYTLIKNLILLQQDDFRGPSIIYTGVGTAAGLRDNNGQLAPMNYHQYPPFLQDMMNAIPNLKLYVVLLDPCLENPPYIVADKNLKAFDDVSEHLLNTKAYISPDERLTVFAINKNICTSLDHASYQEQLCAEDITSDLRMLNQFAMQENITTFYHDFTGRRNNVLAEFFDAEIGTHLDHIIYGFSMREDHGCYFDLTQPGTFFPYYVDAVQMVRVFNYFKYLVTDKTQEVHEEKKAFPPTMQHLIDLQASQIVKSVKTFFTNDLLTIFRTVFRLASGVDEPIADVNPYFFQHILDPGERNHFHETMQAKKYAQVFEELKIYFSKYLHNVALIKQLDVDGYEMINFILHSSEPYSWNANINNFF
jgi:hypothetical protein